MLIQVIDPTTPTQQQHPTAPETQVEDTLLQARTRKRPVVSIVRGDILLFQSCRIGSYL